MAEHVNQGLRAGRIADTEERILRAATELFIRHGYVGTTLAAVAEHAGVGARTVYVRFGTKAALLRRAVDVAFAGDTAPVDMRGRDWFRTAQSAPTLAERVEALAHGSRSMMERAGDIIAVALQAAPTEPDLAAASQAGREATRANIRGFWSAATKDGLLPAHADLDWLTDTTTLLIHAETYLLAKQTFGWTLDTYETWLSTTLTHVATGSR